MNKEQQKQHLIDIMKKDEELGLYDIFNDEKRQGVKDLIDKHKQETMEDFFEELKNRPRPNLVRRIYLWWNHEGRYYHKYFKQGIKNLWYWFPVIWKDRNWDTHFIYEVMKHKLKAQAQYIGDKDRHTNAQRDARNMRICAKLIEKLQDDYYTLEYQDYHKDKVWFTDCEDKPGYSFYNSEVIEDNLDHYFSKYPLVYKKIAVDDKNYTLYDLFEPETKKVIAMKIGHTNEDRARKLLFKIMEQNITSWWD